MNKHAFYASLRRADSGVFGTSISQRQVDVMEAILEQCAGMPLAHTAYILATAYHEPGPKSRMMPNRESLYYTTASRIAAVWPTRFTAASAVPYLRNERALANKVYNGRLGNRLNSDDGYIYRGGGLDHLTGRDNYRRTKGVVGADIEARPERIMEPTIAVRSLVHGMATGRYRGRKLSDYDRSTGYDFVNARSIVNADVSANGNLIAGYARAFLAALEAAEARVVDDPGYTLPTASTGGLAAIFAAIVKALSAFFGKR